MSKSRWEFKGEALIETRKFALEEPGFLGEIGMGALLVLVGNYSTGIAAGSFGAPHSEVHEEVALAGIAELNLIVILYGVLVAVGANAPDVHVKDFCVFVERESNSAFITTLWAQDFDDAAEVLGGAAVGSDGVGRVFKENDSVGVWGVLRKLLLSGRSDPVGNAIGFGSERGERADQEKAKDCEVQEYFAHLLDSRFRSLDYAVFDGYV